MDYSETIEKVKPSIGFVIVMLDNQIQTGSGFVFYKNILVTCNHVVVSSKADIKIKFPDCDEFIDAKVVLQDVEHDLALLKFEDEKKKPLKKGDLENIKEGMPVFFSGYPLKIQTLTTHQGILSSISIDPTGAITYTIDGTVNSGNSGCPLMDQDGRVIGVINAKRRENNQILEEVEKSRVGAISINNIDLTQILNALISNVQLGMGYAVPCSYIPEHKEVQMPKNQIKKTTAEEKKHD